MYKINSPFFRHFTEILKLRDEEAILLGSNIEKMWMKYGESNINNSENRLSATIVVPTNQSQRCHISNP